MSEDWVTTSTLLERLRDYDESSAWNAFVGSFHESIVRFARHRGVDAEAAQDVAQDTLLAFAQAYRRGQYDRARGRLREWLFGIARNRVLMAHRRLSSRRDQPMTDFLAAAAEGQPAEAFNVVDERALEEDRRVWEEEWLRSIYRRCLLRVRDLVRPDTFEMYRLVSSGEHSVEAVAERFGVDRGAVYHARSRVWKQVQECARRYEDA